MKYCRTWYKSWLYMMEKVGHVLKVLVFTLKTEQGANSCSMTAASSQIIQKGLGFFFCKAQKKSCESPVTTPWWVASWILLGIFPYRDNLVTVSCLDPLSLAGEFHRALSRALLLLCSLKSSVCFVNRRNYWAGRRLGFIDKHCEHCYNLVEDAHFVQ